MKCYVKNLQVYRDVIIIIIIIMIIITIGAR